MGVSSDPRIAAASATARPRAERASLLSPRVVMWLIAAVFALLTVPPLVTVVQRSLYTTDLIGEPGTFTLDNYKHLFTQGASLRVVANSLMLAAGATVLALVVGGTLAWVVERTDARGRGVCRAAMLLALAMPYVLYAMAWILLLGPNGPVNQAARHWFGLGQVVKPYSLPVMIFVEGLVSAPLAFLLLAAVLRNMDPSLEECAQVSGAGVGKTLSRVSAPLVTPGGIAVAMLIFVRALEAFEVPAMVGLPGGVTVMTTRIYLGTQRQPPDYGGAGAYAVLLMVAVGVLLALSARITRRGAAYATVTGRGFRPRRVALGRWRFPATALVWLFVLVGLVAPIGLLVWASVLPYYAAPGQIPTRLLTLHNYHAVLGQPALLGSITNTLLIGVCTATVVCLLTAGAGWFVARTRLRGRWVLEQLGGIPLVIPGIIMGLGVSAFYLQVPIAVYGTIWIFVLAFVARYLPYGMRYTGSGLVQIGRELEEAALMSGARPGRTFARIVLPLLMPSLAAAWIFVFLVAGKELSMSVLLSSPDTQVMAVSLFDLFNNGQITQSAAFGVVWTLGLGVCVALLGVIARRARIEIQG
ncbi:ABC transporter permease [Actinoallomurus acaciae]|uniref:ABC transporter permease n=1 Tax=Actinoallomurus acaciae TaxID=502577 RepID=A0ABV5YEW4_9ACTN